MENEIGLVPSNDNLLVQFTESAPTTTASGLLIPESAQSAIQKAKVLAVGEGRVGPAGRVAPVVKAGMTVWFGRANAVEVEFDGKKYHMIAESNLLAYGWR